MEIVLTNLMDNAVKFTGPRDVANFKFRQTDRSGRAGFVLKDNGVGFDMRHSGLLFGPFQRLHKASEFPGTGVGLATVKVADDSAPASANCRFDLGDNELWHIGRIRSSW